MSLSAYVRSVAGGVVLLAVRSVCNASRMTSHTRSCRGRSSCCVYCRNTARLSPRHRAWTQERRACSGGVSHPSERLQSRLKSLPLQPFHIALLEAFPPGHPCGAPLPHPETPVQHQPKSCCTALRLAVGRSGGLPRRAGGAARAVGTAWPPGGLTRGGVLKIR